MTHSDEVPATRAEFHRQHQADAVAEAERLLADGSPLVRGAAVWALSRLAPSRFSALRTTHANDPDPAVRAEWTREAA